MKLSFLRIRIKLQGKAVQNRGSRQDIGRTWQDWTGRGRAGAEGNGGAGKGSRQGWGRQADRERARLGRVGQRLGRGLAWKERGWAGQGWVGQGPGRGRAGQGRDRVRIRAGRQ